MLWYIFPKDDSISWRHLAGLITGVVLSLFIKRQSIKDNQIRLGKN
jgi:membrane associated rhomboid family serine protease